MNKINVFTSRLGSGCLTPKKWPRGCGNALVRGLGMSESRWNSDPGQKARTVGAGWQDERDRFCCANVVIFAGEAGEATEA